MGALCIRFHQDLVHRPFDGFVGANRQMPCDASVSLVIDQLLFSGTGYEYRDIYAAQERWLRRLVQNVDRRAKPAPGDGPEFQLRSRVYQVALQLPAASALSGRLRQM